MVDNDTRNNLVVIIILVAVAVLITSVITVFTYTVLSVAQQAKEAVHMVGKDLVGNISKLNVDERQMLGALNATMSNFTAQNDANLHLLIKQVDNQTNTLIKSFKNDTQ